MQRLRVCKEFKFSSLNLCPLEIGNMIATMFHRIPLIRTYDCTDLTAGLMIKLETMVEDRARLHQINEKQSGSRDVRIEGHS